MKHTFYGIQFGELEAEWAFRRFSKDTIPSVELWSLMYGELDSCVFDVWAKFDGCCHVNTRVGYVHLCGGPAWADFFRACSVVFIEAFGGRETEWVRRDLEIARKTAGAYALMEMEMEMDIEEET